MTRTKTRSFAIAASAALAFGLAACDVDEDAIEDPATEDPAVEDGTGEDDL